MNNNEKINFTDEFLSVYLSNGLGSLPKSEIDILVFHLLVSGIDFRGMSNYELASRFKIPESRIRNLRLNSALKYEDINSKAILSKIVERLVNSDQFAEFESGKIEVSLENPIEKRELENHLKMQGHFAEYTLNSEVLRIAPVRLLELIIANVENPSNEFNAIVQANVKAQEQQKKLMDNSLTLKQKFNKLRNEVMTVDTLKELIKSGAAIFTAGAI